MAASNRALVAPEPTLPGVCAVVGIDIAKLKFDVCCLNLQGARPQHGTFTSDDEGHARFIKWVDRVAGGQSVHFCMEETGIYGRALATFLHQSGHRVSLVNPALIKSFGASLNVRTKTDSVDAQLIAHYTAERVPPPWKPLEPQHQALRAAARRRQQLMEMLIAESNHLEACLCPAVRSSIEVQIAHLKSLITAEDERMAAIIAGDALLARAAQLLRTIPGIGRISAQRLLAELPPLDGFESARQLCAYAGLTPRQHESGKSVHGRSRLCKQGRSGLRATLFMPAMSLLTTRSGPLKEFADRLLKSGKEKLCVIGALTRKLMSLAFAILRSGTPCDPGYRNPATRQSGRQTG